MTTTAHDLAAPGRSPATPGGAGQRSRRIEGARIGWGLLLLAAPTRVLGATGARVDTRSVVITRVLGVRQLTQGLLSGLRPSPEVLAMGVWVDAAHSATALGLAVVDPGRAVAGVTDAAVAAGWSWLGLRDLRRAVATPPAHDRVRDALARAVLRVAPGGARLLHLADRARG
jgi:hypothetical protein